MDNPPMIHQQQAIRATTIHVPLLPGEKRLFTIMHTWIGLKEQGDWMAGL